MKHKNTIENILINRYFGKLNNTGTMYWNKRDDAILVYAKANEKFKEIHPKMLIDTLLKMDFYENEFWFISPSFDMFFVGELIKSGFIIESGRNYINKYNKKWLWDDKYLGKKYFWSKEMMFAMLYKKYPVLYLNNIHEPKSAVRLLNKYELKMNMGFDKIVDKCAEIHGNGWLSTSMRNCYKKLHRKNDTDFKFVSFELYRNNELKAGEFGCIIGKIYISYSGYYEESSAGTVQMIKMFRHLRVANFVCCNLFGYGESYKYKYKFGAIDVNFRDYIKLFNENTKLSKNN